MLEDYQKLEALVNDFQPDIIVHLLRKLVFVTV